MLLIRRLSERVIVTWPHDTMAAPNLCSATSDLKSDPSQSNSKGKIQKLKPHCRTKKHGQAKTYAHKLINQNERTAYIPVIVSQPISTLQCICVHVLHRCGNTYIVLHVCVLARGMCCAPIMRYVHGMGWLSGVWGADGMHGSVACAA